MKITKQQLYEIIIEETIKEVQQRNKLEPINEARVPILKARASGTFVKAADDFIDAWKKIRTAASNGWFNRGKAGFDVAKSQEVLTHFQEVIQRMSRNWFQAFDEILEWKLLMNAPFVGMDADKAVGALSRAHEEFAKLLKKSDAVQQWLQGQISMIPLPALGRPPLIPPQKAHLNALKEELKALEEFVETAKDFHKRIVVSETISEKNLLDVLNVFKRGKPTGFFKGLWNKYYRANKTVLKKARKGVEAEKKAAKAARDGSKVVADSMLRKAARGLGFSKIGMYMTAYALFEALVPPIKWIYPELAANHPVYHWVFQKLNLIIKHASIPSFFMTLGVTHLKAERYNQMMANSKDAIKGMATVEGQQEFKRRAQNSVILNLIQNRLQVGGPIQGRYEKLWMESIQPENLGTGIKIAYNDDPNTKKIIDDILENLFANAQVDNVKEIFNKQEYMLLFLSRFRQWAARQKVGEGHIIFALPNVTHDLKWETYHASMCAELRKRSNENGMKLLNTPRRAVGLPDLPWGPSMEPDPDKKGKEQNIFLNFCDKEKLLQYERQYVFITNMLSLNQQTIIKNLKAAAKKTEKEIKKALHVEPSDFDKYIKSLLPEPEAEPAPASSLDTGNPRIQED